MHSTPTPVLFAAALCTLSMVPLSTLSALPQEAEIAREERPLPSLSEATAGLTRHDGLLPLWIDRDRGRLLLEVQRFDTEYLLSAALTGGLGSNPVGLDRGMNGPNRLVRFERAGRKVLLIERNLRFRSDGTNAEAQRAIEESFATSTLGALPIVAASGERVLLNATPLVMRDALGIARTLEQSGEGTYELDAELSAPRLDAARSYPSNLELEASLTFRAKAKVGAEADRVAPEGSRITLRQRLSFVALPDANYRPRSFDPRFGSNFIAFQNHAAAIDMPLMQRWILRHRLQKRDPAAERSPAIKPIVYYVDRSAPEEVRTALIEGASWWKHAFEALGYVDAFRVERMPDDLDPADARYNVILWVHRETRGWSYGSTVVDPRTGEILRGVVRLGSQRMRQDVLLYRGLLGAAAEEEVSPGRTRAVDLALARLRQLAAHEVGHTLGFVHNFAASSQGRSSVMDYPAPRIALRSDSSFDLSQAYTEGLGAWDHIAVRAAYGEFGSRSQELEGLQALVESARQQGLYLLSERDARPDSSMHPQASLWDNEVDGVSELRQAIAVRTVALARFSVDALPLHRPTSELEEIFLPLYLHHRYGLEAAAKVIGGVEYQHALRGDGASAPRVVSGGLQRAALKELLATLRPDFLRLPAGLWNQFPPRATAYANSGETVPSRTSPAFDPLAPAEISIHRTLELLLHPARLARVIDQHAADAGALSLPELIGEVLYALQPRATELENATDAQILRIAQRLFIERCVALASDENARGDVRAVAEDAIGELKLEAGGDTVASAHSMQMQRRILRFINRTESESSANLAPSLPLPAGAPIGSHGAAEACCDHAFSCR